MAKLNLVLALPGLVLFICAAGCNREVDLSPDGKTVVTTNGNEVVFHDTTTKRPDIAVKLEGVGSPRFSPDSEFVAVGHGEVHGKSNGKKAGQVIRNSGTDVITKGGEVKFSVPGVYGPYAWRPDGSELAGTDEDGVAVIHIRSHQIVRHYPFAGNARQAAWLGTGRDLAFGTDDSLTVIHNGVAKQHALKGKLGGISFDTTQNRVIWVEITHQEGKDLLPRGEVAVRASDLQLAKTETLLEQSAFAELLAPNGRVGVPTNFAVSPDGSVLAVTGIVDASKSGLMDRYIALGGFHKPGQLKKEVARKLGEIEKQLRFQVVCATTPIGVSNPKATRRISSDIVDSKSNNPFWSDKVIWTDGGKSVAMLVNDNFVKKVSLQR